jgi:SAM-dependent methyltransferase
MAFHVDEFVPGHISGWSQTEDGPTRVKLLVNGVLKAETIADGYRADLADAGFGSGHLGFAFSMRRPGLMPGDKVELIDAASQSALWSGVMSLEAPRGLSCAYDLIDSIEPLDRPFWRSGLAESGDNLAIGGQLFVPDKSRVPTLYDLNEGSSEVTIEKASTHAASQYWFLDGESYSARAVIRRDDTRHIFVLRAHEDERLPRDLNFCAVPSSTDFDRFQFPGADRASRVAGGDNTIERFASGGLTAALQLCKITDSIDRLSRTATVLDWGCGAGRVLQFLARERPAWVFDGADIDAVNIDWCKDHLSRIASFAHIPLHPPTNYESGHFDLIYGLSVITHLEEATRDAWIDELARISKPGGICILTYMSPFHLSQGGFWAAKYQLYEDLATRGISDSLHDFALGEQLSDYYRATFCTLSNLKHAVADKFTVIGSDPRSLLFQDAIILQRHLS